MPVCRENGVSAPQRANRLNTILFTLNRLMIFNHLTYIIEKTNNRNSIHLSLPGAHSGSPPGSRLPESFLNKPYLCINFLTYNHYADYRNSKD